jgi:hypothetical protein
MWVRLASTAFLFCLAIVMLGEPGASALFAAPGRVVPLRATVVPARAQPRAFGGQIGFTPFLGGPTLPGVSPIDIRSPGFDTRVISANVRINAPVEEVWSIITDYNRLAEYVPNLVESYVKPSRDGRTLLYQKGAQDIFGFSFSAALTMDMNEGPKSAQRRVLDFKLVDSICFSNFDGSWEVSAIPGTSATRLTYTVRIRPNGPVPVAALEWRIREDVPVNLAAVKKVAERRRAR